MALARGFPQAVDVGDAAGPRFPADGARTWRGALYAQAVHARSLLAVVNECLAEPDRVSPTLHSRADDVRARHVQLWQYLLPRSNWRSARGIVGDAIDRRKACGAVAIGVGRSLFTINDIDEGFLASRICTDRQVNQWVARADRRVIGKTVLVNSGTRTSFLIDDEAPILRERDTLPPRQHVGQAAYLCLQT